MNHILIGLIAALMLAFCWVPPSEQTVQFVQTCCKVNVYTFDR